MTSPALRGIRITHPLLRDPANTYTLERARPWFLRHAPLAPSDRPARGTLDADTLAARAAGSLGDPVLALEVLDILGVVEHVGYGTYRMLRPQPEAWAAAWENLGDLDLAADATVDAVCDGCLGTYPSLFGAPTAAPAFG